MSKKVRPILYRTTILVVFIVLAIFLFIKFYSVGEFTFFLYFIPFIPAIINSLFIVKLNHLLKLSPNVFFRKYMILSAVKFMVNLFVFILLIVAFKAKPVPIIIVYLSTYFILFIQEIVEIQSLIRKID